MMEVVNFVGRYYFVLGLLAFYLCFMGAGFSAFVARRQSGKRSRREETARALQEIAQYQTYVRYVEALTRQNQAALRNRTARYGGLRKVA